LNNSLVHFPAHTSSRARMVIDEADTANQLSVLRLALVLAAAKLF
tara:strand:- start:670 stop:804 length:135 start_codon:yes stop_codon:yes gene_type:complete